MVMLATLKVTACPGGAGGAVLALWSQGTSMSWDYTAPLREIPQWNCEFQAQRSTDICTLPRVKHSSWEAAVEHSGLSSMLCDDLEGQDGGGAREGGDICTHGADS